jgi:ribosomal-protein-alanine N-acetyltransferase
MNESDLHRCARIEREAFPSLFPPTSFGRELKNRLAHYLVVEPRGDGDSEPKDIAEARPEKLIKRLLSGASPVLGRSKARQSSVVGFIGVWYVADEAHIVNIGVSGEHRGNGLGELLLIGAVEHAQSRGIRMVTLEVRESNFIARNLYRKYGFTERGLRKAYYSDNRENAVIMTTEPIAEPAFREGFVRLVSAHELARGHSVRTLG